MAISPTYIGKANITNSNATSLSFGNFVIPSDGLVVAFACASNVNSGRWLSATIGGSAATVLEFGTTTQLRGFGYRAMAAGTHNITFVRENAGAAGDDYAVFVWLITGTYDLATITSSIPGNNSGTSHTNTLTALAGSITLYGSVIGTTATATFSAANSDDTTTGLNGGTSQGRAGHLAFVSDSVSYVETISHSGSVAGGLNSINIRNFNGTLTAEHAAYTWGAEEVDVGAGAGFNAAGWSWGAQAVGLGLHINLTAAHSTWAWSARSMAVQLNMAIAAKSYTWGAQAVDLLKRRPTYNIDFNIPNYSQSRPDGEDELSKLREVQDSLED